MRRREFIAGLGGAAAAWPVVARAQRTVLPVVGLLGTQSRELWKDRLDAFRRGLGETGHVEGRTVALEYRFVDDDKDQLSTLALDLVARRVNVIAAFGGPPPALAAKARTASIPIVFTLSSDPTEIGLVTSLAHPGGNLTGATTLNMEVSPKRLELMHELAPTATMFGLLVDPKGTSQEIELRELNAAADKLGLRLRVLRASVDRDIDDAFAFLAELKASGIVIGISSFLISRIDKLAALALRHRMPAVYLYREFAVAGGLMSYGGSLAEGYRLAGVYTGRILNGEKPADLPVQQATRIDLVINMRTAKALGLNLPQSILLRADEVIE
jgi:putative tryptophan/tyrosine transport system substrate-binding protein